MSTDPPHSGSRRRGSSFAGESLGGFGTPTVGVSPPPTGSGSMTGPATDRLGRVALERGSYSSRVPPRERLIFGRPGALRSLTRMKRTIGWASHATVQPRSVRL
jgi:hypothetical protein